ncbi:hypothetical protein ERHA54_05510 [Erwinia rhapontici]|nr:hypothetical protein ERHA54_05510 [Erwinia rhapontici]BCQ43048.1 hypothetical protein ERHA55_05750 [Erwinia rhapontici]
MSCRFDFSNKQVWITGAGQGIGYHTALAFVAAGASVVGFDKQFSQNDYPFQRAIVDISDADQVKRVCQRLLSDTPRLDVLVNAAGILRTGSTEELAVEDWQACMAVNAGGHSICSSKHCHCSVSNVPARLSLLPPMRHTRRVSVCQLMVLLKQPCVACASLSGWKWLPLVSAAISFHPVPQTPRCNGACGINRKTNSR